MIVDAHVHVVSGDRSRYPLRPSGVGTDWYLAPGIDVDGVRRAGASDAVLVQAYGAYSTDNAYVLDAADETGWPAVVVAATADELRRLVAERGARGARLFAIDGGGPIEDAAMWTAAADVGVPIVVATLPGGLAALEAMLGRFPDVPVALDHCAFVDDAHQLSALAPFPQLHLKVTTHALGLFDALCDAFGVERLLWGSDFPQVHDRSYAQLVELGRRACAQLAEEERAAYLGGNARRLWPPL